MLEIKINSWRQASCWKWIVDESEVCGICRCKFEDCCRDCQIPGDDCPLIWGECAHVFHLHCLLKWLERESSRNLCPMDRREWKTKT